MRKQTQSCMDPHLRDLFGQPFRTFSDVSRNQNGILATAIFFSTRLTFFQARNRLRYQMAGCPCISKRIYVKRLTNCWNKNWQRHATVPIAHQICWSWKKMVKSGWSSTIDNWKNKQLNLAGPCLLLKNFLTLWKQICYFSPTRLYSIQYSIWFSRRARYANVIHGKSYRFLISDGKSFSRFYMEKLNYILRRVQYFFSYFWETHWSTSRGLPTLHANLKINSLKCEIFRRRVPSLSHLASRDGIQAGPARTSAMCEYLVPNSNTEVKCFFWLCSYYRWYFRNFAAIARPLHQLTEKTQEVHWNWEAQQVFEQLEDCLTSSPILAFTQRRSHSSCTLTQVSLQSAPSLLKYRMASSESFAMLPNLSAKPLFCTRQ